MIPNIIVLTKVLCSITVNLYFYGRSSSLISAINAYPCISALNAVVIDCLGKLIMLPPIVINYMSLPPPITAWNRPILSKLQVAPDK